MNWYVNLNLGHTAFLNAFYHHHLLPLLCPHLSLPSPLAPTYMLLAMVSELYLTLVRTGKAH